jgi:diguanylate cyclase (GGDEF)-like protein/PAS domain S-box-containing protein/putative nucleotidyltransferase with HDIG domain
MDLGLRYTYMSPAITRMRGYTAEEIMDAPITETMTPASVEVARKTFAERVALERAGQLGPHDATKVELEMYCKDGSTIWTEMNMVWLRNSEGKPIGILGVTRDISERKKAEAERERLNAELEMRAITDSLTGLYDHAHFYQRLAEEIDRSKRYKHGFAVVMMDVDDFKRFNDSRGHQMGDAMLRLVADCIRAGLRSSDIAFRYGGDEFSAILPHADSSKAKAAVSRINGHIAKKLKQIDGGSATRLSLSAGVACFPEDGTTADVLVRIADAALYSAKWVARARDIMGQREDIQSLISALVSRRGEVESPADGTIFRPEALHEQQARIVSSVASSIAVALKDAGVSQALEDPDLQVLATVGAAAEIKDRYIRGHPERTSEVAAALAEEMGLSSEQVRNIKIAGLLHDIGKITVSESILNKPGKLTKREFANIKDHPIVGATLVSQVKGFEHLIPIVRHHHERFDGKGYPDGLTGEEIPLEARIMSVVDVFDALTHERSYREALNSAQATAELERSAGTQFDPVVLEAFLALAKARGDALTDFPQAAGENGQPAAAKAAGRGKR